MWNGASCYTRNGKIYHVFTIDDELLIFIIFIWHNAKYILFSIVENGCFRFPLWRRAINRVFYQIGCISPKLHRKFLMLIIRLFDNFFTQEIFPSSSINDFCFVLTAVGRRCTSDTMLTIITLIIFLQYQHFEWCLSPIIIHIIFRTKQPAFYTVTRNQMFAFNTSMSVTHGKQTFGSGFQYRKLVVLFGKLCE